MQAQDGILNRILDAVSRLTGAETIYSAKNAVRHGEIAHPAARTVAAGLAGFALLVWHPAAAHAGELFTADGIDVRWDNTLAASSAARIMGPDRAILANPNRDDGDRNFAPGFVSNRLDLASQLDLGQGDLGLHASAAAWYDAAYHRHTDNDSEATYNAANVPATRFAPAVRALYGQYAELDDAFVYDTMSVENVPLSLRAGRQTVLWGESLFFDPNSIASAEAPTDYTRITTGESSYSNNVYLPVTQLFAAAQFSPTVSLTLYDQLEARSARETGDGGYLSYVDFIGAGAGKLFLPSGRYLTLENDGSVSAAGQFGAALHATIDQTDFGLYALQYNAKDPEIYEVMAASPQNPQIAGFYGLVYPKHITLYGMSASSALGDGTIAGEISLRQRAPLLIYAPEEIGGEGESLTYVRGELFHLQASTRLPLGSSPLWDDADFSAEVAADEVTSTSSAAATPADRFAMRARLLIEPHYFQLLPNLDLTLPMALGTNLTGHGFSYYEQNGGTGDFQVGISALYRSAWKASLTLTGFIGSPVHQPLADRDFIALRLERSF